MWEVSIQYGRQTRGISGQNKIVEEKDIGVVHMGVGVGFSETVSINML